MPEMIENHMLIDGYWGETEYGVPSGDRIRRERQAYEEAEREEKEWDRERGL